MNDQLPSDYIGLKGIVLFLYLCGRVHLEDQFVDKGRLLKGVYASQRGQMIGLLLLVAGKTVLDFVKIAHSHWALYSIIDR